MTNEWDEFADCWDTDAEVIAYAEKALRSLNQVSPVTGFRVLDFGCGTGSLAERIAPRAKAVVGLDTSLAMLAVLNGKQIPNIAVIGEELSAELIESHALLRPRFDLIVASSVCGSLPNYEQVLSLLKSLLVPGGLFVQWDWLRPREGKGRGFTQEAVECSLRTAGFDAITVSLPFSADGPDGDCKVVMGTGENS